MATLDEVLKEVERRIALTVEQAVPLIAEELKKDMKEETRRQVDFNTSSEWYGTNEDRGQNTGVPVEEMIEIMNISTHATGGSITLDYENGAGGHESWSKKKGKLGSGIIDILEDNGFTRLSGGRVKPSTNIVETMIGKVEGDKYINIVKEAAKSQGL